MKSTKPRLRKDGEQRRSPKRTPEHFSGEWVGESWLCQRYGISRTTRWKRTKDGLLPPPVELLPGIIRWKLTDLLAWEAARATARHPAA
jgi:prophage regulatory protein